MLCDRQIPALYNGISQQPATLRMPSQAEVQINAWSTVVEGLRERPPTQHVAKLTSSDLSAAHLHTINRDTTERYHVVLTDGDLKVYDLNGNAKTVNFPHGKAYLSFGGVQIRTWAAGLTFTSIVNQYVNPTVANGFTYQVTGYTGAGGGSQPTWPTSIGGTVTSGGVTYTCRPASVIQMAAQNFSAVTVADYTFIINKTKVVQMKAVAADQTAPPNTYYWLNTAAAGSEATYNPILAARLKQYPPNTSGGTLLGTVQSFDYLPGGPSAPAGGPAPNEGDLYTIQGNAASAFTTYYVRYHGGVWDETVAYGLQNAIDETTMPWALVRKSDGTFDFAPFSWAPRRVGDEQTNPNPSFVGRTLRDVFFYQNRLGFTVDENLVCSAAGDFGNFYRLTVVQLLPSEVVDVGASETQVTKLNFAVPFATGMMLFADQTQFRVVTPQASGLTPTTVSLEVATRYIASTFVRPKMIGSDAYFISEDADFAKIREYFVKVSYLGQIQTAAADITAHVPTFIPVGCYLLEGSLNQDALFTATTQFPNRLYVYQFYWTDETTKAQSAWGYWDFGAGNKVLAASALDDYLFLLIARSDGTYLEKMSLAIGANVGLTDTNGKKYDILLDRRCVPTGVYNGGTGKTSYAFPYAVDQASVRLIQTNGATPGAMYDPSTYTFPDSTHVAVPGDTHLVTALGGNYYTFRYTFSEQFMLNRQGVAVLGGRLTLRNFTVFYNNTAFFNTEVDPYGTGTPNVIGFLPSQEAAYSGMTVGQAALVIGSPVFKTGSFTFGVFGDAKEATISLTNNTPYPVNFVEAEWEGEFTKRSQTL